METPLSLSARSRTMIVPWGRVSTVHVNSTGDVDTEHGSSSTADHAMDVVRKLAEET
jgi:hypothetical protein